MSEKKIWPYIVRLKGEGDFKTYFCNTLKKFPNGDIEITTDKKRVKIASTEIATIECNLDEELEEEVTE